MASVSLKHRLEYIAVVAAAAVVRRLPRQKALALGKALGRVSMKVLPSRYRLAKDNMIAALPELSAAEIETNIRKNFEHIGICGVEMLRFDMFQSGAGVEEEIFHSEGMPFLEEALALDRGVLLLSAHLGFWEVGSFALAEHDVQVDIVAKPLKNPLTERYFSELRKNFGAEILSSRKGARRILQSLKSKHVVGILLDQHISPPGSVAVNFFGRPAFTTTAVANMAMKLQVPVVPVFCLRQPDNSYHTWAEPMLLLSGEGEDAVVENTQYLTDIIETAIRKDVSQWFWMHKRWREKKQKKKVMSQ